MINTKSKQGSIALISVLITMAVLMIIVSGMTEKHISAAQQYLNSENNRTLYYAAEACLEETIKRIENDTDFSNGTLSINDESATICTIAVTGGSTKNITLTLNKGNYSQSYSARITMTTKASANNTALIEWNRTQ